MCSTSRVDGRIDRVGLTSDAITKVAGSAWNRILYDNNMSLEAFILDIKTRNKRSKESIANVPSWMVCRYEETKESMALARTQIVSHPQKMRKRSSQKKSRVDGLREEDREVIWQRGNTGISRTLEDIWDKMITSLKAAMHVEKDSEDGEKYQFQRSNVLSIFRALEYVSTKSNCENLSQSQFYEWHNGDRRRLLPRDFVAMIEELHSRYVKE